jgi:UDP-N-acetylmuramoyl-tripeptide--D-alanyl-D-alanine ligase
MPLFDPADLASWTGGQWRGPKPASALGPLVADTRSLRPGELFVALRTARRDGHDFLETARAAGAAGAVVSREMATALAQLQVADPAAAWRDVAREHRLRFPGPVVGVTGSAGKTSTKDLLKEILNPAVHATRANENNLLGVPLTLCALDPAVHRAAVVEAGISEPGEMAALADMIRPDVAVVTLVAPAHLEKLGSVENVAKEKALLARAVRPGGFAVFPAACLAHAAFLDLPETPVVVAPKGAAIPGGKVARIFRYQAERRPRNGWRLGLAEEGGPERSWSLPAVTPGLAANAALAVVVAQLLGVSDDRIQAGLADWRAAPLRGELLKQGNKTFLADCYNANPASLADALAGFVARVDPVLPRLYILGSMAELGPEAAALHRVAVADVRLRREDRALMLGPNADDYRAGLMAAGNPGGQVCVAELEDARGELERFAGAVFLKGSRAYALERLLPENLREGREAHAPC